MNQRYYIAFWGIAVGIYSKLEDGYYGLLDKIQRAIPIYSIIDPLDRIFPTFVLVLILLLAGIGGIALWFLNQNAAPTELKAYIKVLDKDDKPLKDVTVSLTIEGETQSLTTNSQGIIQIKLKKPSVAATVSIKEDTFKEIKNKEITLTADHTEKIKLETEIAGLAPQRYVITIEDSSTNEQIHGTMISVSFTCQYTTQHPQDKTTSNGNVVVEPDSACGQLTASFAPLSKYQGKNGVAITSTDQTVQLDPLNVPQTGTLEVTVTDQNNKGVANAQVNYWSSLTPNSPTAATPTDAQGKTRVVDLAVGTYGVSAIAPDGRQAQQTGISIEANDLKKVTLQLPALTSGKKIFIKLVDSDANQSIPGVTIILYDGTTRLGAPGTTNAQGIFEQNVDQKTSSDFSAVFFEPSYVIRFLSLSAVDSNQTNPTKIALTKALKNEAGVPLNYGIAIIKTQDEDSKPVPNANVQIFRSDYVNPVFSTKTGPDANVSIPLLPPASGILTYVAKAYSTINDANGASDPRVLAIGETKDFPITLYVGTGKFKVTTVDAGNPSLKIAGASVLAYYWDPVTQTKKTLDQGQTGTDGKWESKPIKTNFIVRLDVSATGRMKFTSEAFGLHRDQTIEVTVPLYSLITFPGDACTKKEDCSGEQVCTDGKCEQPCSSSADCQYLGGYYCALGGTCELPPANYCDDLHPCSSCQSCVNNQCAEPEGKSCTPGSSNQCCNLVCDAQQSICRNPTGDTCTGDADCSDNGFKCVGGNCQKSCSVDSDCPAGMACGINEYCESISPTNALKLVFEEIRGKSLQDPPNPPQLIAGKEYHAKFRLELSRDGNWEELAFHFRMGPDSDYNGLDQNVFILNIADTIPEAPFDSVKYSSKTDLKNIFSTPEGGEGGMARQVNATIPKLASQRVYTLAVKFKIKDSIAAGTPLPLFFQARGKNKGDWFVTPKHLQSLAVGKTVCTTNCPRFVWAYYLNSLNNPILNPITPTMVGENQDLTLYYTLFNTSQSQSYSNASLAVSSSTPNVLSVVTQTAFENQTLPAQTLFDYGMRVPIQFKSNSTVNGTEGELDLSLTVSPDTPDPSKNQAILFTVQPDPSFQAPKLIGITDSHYLIEVKQLKDAGTVPVEGAQVQARFNFGKDSQGKELPICTNLSIPNSTWDDECTTADIGRCTLTKMTTQNAGNSIMVQVTKAGYKTKRVCLSVNGPSPTFGEPKTCLKLQFPGQNPGTKNTVFAQRPSDVSIQVVSECDGVVDVLAEPLGLDLITQSGNVAMEGDLASRKPIQPGGTITGALRLTNKSPLGFIPIVLNSFPNGNPTNVPDSKFIAGRAKVSDPTAAFEIITEG